MDKYCKKLVANVNCGLLEKSANKAQKSKLFNTLGEARYHQAIYGGKMSILKKFHEGVVEVIEEVETNNEVMSWTKIVERITVFSLQTTTSMASLKRIPSRLNGWNQTLNIASCIARRKQTQNGF